MIERIKKALEEDSNELDFRVYILKNLLLTLEHTSADLGRKLDENEEREVIKKFKKTFEPDKEIATEEDLSILDEFLPSLPEFDDIKTKIDEIIENEDIRTINKTVYVLGRVLPMMKDSSDNDRTGIYIYNKIKERKTL